MNCWRSKTYFKFGSIHAFFLLIITIPFYVTLIQEKEMSVAYFIVVVVVIVFF